MIRLAAGDFDGAIAAYDQATGFGLLQAQERRFGSGQRILSQLDFQFRTADVFGAGAFQQQIALSHCQLEVLFSANDICFEFGLGFGFLTKENRVAFFGQKEALHRFQFDAGAFD